MNKYIQEKKKIIVTGAKGFVGSAIFSELINDYETYGLIRSKNISDDPDLLKNGKLFQADITENSCLSNLEGLKKIDFVIHCAGLAHQFGNVSLDSFRKTNLGGTKNILEQSASRGLNQFILISSVAVYGNKDYPVTELDSCDPQTFYAVSKLEAEQFAIDFCRENKIVLTILRLSTVIGENDRGNTARLIMFIDKGVFFWIGNGVNKKSLIYRNDVGRAVRKLVESLEDFSFISGEPQIYNLTGDIISMKEIVNTIADALGREVKNFRLPKSLFNVVLKLNSKTFNSKKVLKFQTTLQKWLSNDIYVSEKFNKKFKFEPELKIQESISRQVATYLKSKASKK